jgi:hypothetical protein
MRINYRRNISVFIELRNKHIKNGSKMACQILFTSMQESLLKIELDFYTGNKDLATGIDMDVRSMNTNHRWEFFQTICLLNMLVAMEIIFLNNRLRVLRSK